MPYRLLAQAASRATGRLGWARGAVGALLGIAAASLVTDIVLGANGAALPWLVAPLGASAVLVFALPASPLAQPWPVFGGSLLSTLIGLAVGHFVPFTPAAAALAVAMAIGAMSMTRCLHPPGGACAMLAAMGGPLIATSGWQVFLLAIALDLVALLALAWWYNNLTGHSWPHRAANAKPAGAPGWIARYEPEDLDAVLDEWDEVLDVSRDDLDALFRAVEARAHERARTRRGPRFWKI